MTTKSKLAERIDALLKISEKNQRQIADEIGYERPNLITMFKQGRSKVPINKVGPLAIALGADPAHLTRMALQEYVPETYEAIKKYLGEPLSENERRILNVIRDESGDTDPHLTESAETKLRKLVRSLR